MEDIVRAAFHADLGLFVTTGGGSGGGGEGGAVRSGVGDKTYFPNPHAAALHEDSEQLFEFVGRMLGKALYEGVTLDVPLAPFFVRRVLGGASSIDELPELDTQLYSSLAFVRTYAGDVAELGLTFAVDVEVMGVHSSIELRPGGSAIAVDNANRIHVRCAMRATCNARRATRAARPCALCEPGAARVPLPDLTSLSRFSHHLALFQIPGPLPGFPLRARSTCTSLRTTT